MDMDSWNCSALTGDDTYTREVHNILRTDVSESSCLFFFAKFGRTLMSIILHCLIVL